MDKPKSIIVKSKSSNTTLETKKNTKHNKKSRSNAEFQQFATINTVGCPPIGLKKRGVYVEKKPSNSSNRDRSPHELPTKRSHRRRSIPRPGRKRFLASVLTILSQSTAGTQFPEGADTIGKLEPPKNNLRRTREEEVIYEDSATSPNTTKRKPKYRSKILNNLANGESEPLVVLQSTKDIIQTPSYNSECTNIKSAVSTFNDRESMKWAESLVTYNEKELQKTNSKKKVRLVEEPSSVIANLPKREEKNFYNFFVDVLKTTFSVYNVQTDVNEPLPTSNNSSKVRLEIDENVAKKLDIQEIKAYESKETYDVSQKPSFKYVHNIIPDDRPNWNDTPFFEEFQPNFSQRYREESTCRLPRRRKLISDSFNNKSTTPATLLKHNSATAAPKKKKKTLKRDRKREFINLLKEELQMPEDGIEQTPNFFESLKVMARNKRRRQPATIQLGASRRPSGGDVHVCQFKRRTLLSRKSSRKDSDNPENRDFKSSNKKEKAVTIEEFYENAMESNHSLEVVEYETDKKKKHHKITPKYSSSSSTGLHEYRLDKSMLMCCAESNNFGASGGMGTSSILLQHNYDLDM